MPKANGTTKLAKMLGVSRQRAWAILRGKEGKCLICGQPRSVRAKLYCERHRQMMNRISLAGYHRRKLEAK